MSEMILPPRHRIRNSNPGGLRQSTLPLSHGGSPVRGRRPVSAQQTQHIDPMLGRRRRQWTSEDLIWQGVIVHLHPATERNCPFTPRDGAQLSIYTPRRSAIVHLHPATERNCPFTPRDGA